jgi:hypothetical protein
LVAVGERSKIAHAFPMAVPHLDAGDLEFLEHWPAADVGFAVQVDNFLFSIPHEILVAQFLLAAPSVST